MSQQVIPLYMDHMELFQCQAIVTKVDKGELNKKPYQWIQLNQTIFHPKGGGQLSDEGKINEIDVTYVHKELFDKNQRDQFQILHCFDAAQDLSFKVGDTVDLVVNQHQRKMYSRLHTAGHVLADVVQLAFPGLKAFHGNHDPQNAYVRFMIGEYHNTCEKQEIIDQVQPKLMEHIEKNSPVVVVKLPSGMRAIQIGDSSMPCGGTHVSCLQQIGCIEAFDVSINKKEATMTIKYRLVDL